ncbi:thioredoxin-like protein [Protomyces lactucae-debilis]|uniref:Monothiol glutaredoxin-5, mitochondrial n=1 Tax=Protomyces lactucae-debilis TaxID=2754530 RepID=A0A1Y2ERJ1_PROLT|nr:thioredoxin-like protein [Protomyces lactucae-debilis]ORY73465.1 thioredoxin-like protein [Protomyces lactucae-debilis]
MNHLLKTSRLLLSKTPALPALLSQSRALSDATKTAIESAIAASPVVLFMKGTPEQPMCGFSRATIQILGLQGVDPKKLSAFNVLEDQELREGIKEFSEWPTIPQLYVNKEFVGGCDILVGMHQSGELETFLEKADVLVPPVSATDADGARPPQGA